MIYRVIGLTSSNPAVGLDMCFVEFTEIGGRWNYEMVVENRVVYSNRWAVQLNNAANISVLEYQLLHAAFGQYIGGQVNDFIRQNRLDHRVHLIASHGHTVFNLPGQSVITQLGLGAAIAAETKLPVVSELLSLDLAFGGQGLPIAAIGQKLLSPDGQSLHLPDVLIIALMGVLRWREEANMLSTATGARQDSIGGALWLGNGA